MIKTSNVVKAISAEITFFAPHLWVHTRTQVQIQTKSVLCQRAVRATVGYLAWNCTSPWISEKIYSTLKYYLYYHRI